MACPHARSSSSPLARGESEQISEFLWEPLPLAWLPGLSLEAQRRVLPPGRIERSWARNKGPERRQVLRNTPRLSDEKHDSGALGQELPKGQQGGLRASAFSPKNSTHFPTKAFSLRSPTPGHTGVLVAQQQGFGDPQGGEICNPD